MTASTQSSRVPLILIVDDEPCSLAALSQALRSAGYAVEEACRGEEALERYEAVAPDLVLMDIHLPGDDGLQVSHWLRERHGEGCAPVVLMSGYNDRFADGDGFPPGVVDFLAKPFSIRQALVHIRAHLEARRYALRQKELAEELARAHAAKDRVLGMCAHDLRSPLSSVRGLADCLLGPDRGALSTEQADIVRTMRDACQGMVDLVNDLLDLTVIEAEGLRLRRAPASLREIVAHALRLASAEAARKGSSFVFEAAPGDDFRGVFDPARVRGVVDNLLGNALKFSPPGARILVRLEREPEDAASPALRFSVRDQGPGVPEQERDRLFQAFGRLSARPTSGEPSTGLGLCIARKIVEAHGGQISALNHPQGGCVFSFTLPPTPCSPPVPSSSSTTSPMCDVSSGSSSAALVSAS